MKSWAPIGQCVLLSAFLFQCDNDNVQVYVFCCLQILFPLVLHCQRCVSSESTAMRVSLVPILVMSRSKRKIPPCELACVRVSGSRCHILAYNCFQDHHYSCGTVSFLLFSSSLSIVLCVRRSNVSDVRLLPCTQYRATGIARPGQHL